MSSPDIHHTVCVSDVYNTHILHVDVPLTPSNVMRAVREVKKWWGSRLEYALTGWLFIPESKQDEIRRNFPDEMEQKRQAISYWINTDPLASWRRIITALDRIRETKVADSIRSNAEPLTGIVTMYYYCMLSCTTAHTVHYASHYTMYTALEILTLINTSDSYLPLHVHTEHVMSD